MMPLPAIEALKKYRIPLSAAFLVAVVLVLFVHAPIVPVLAGCVLAVAFAILRTRAAQKTGTGKK
ncbi:MAG TPA: hypothetical protein VNI36_03560 [Candidatus Dormibacteraeota bacterium]|nr:hypothetical protein [Candidatus Dormibacteraeota bacterium]